MNVRPITLPAEKVTATKLCANPARGPVHPLAYKLVRPFLPFLITDAWADG